MSVYSQKPLETSQMRTRSLCDRAAKVDLGNFAKVYNKDSGVNGLVDSLPRILAGVEFRRLVVALIVARSKARSMIWGLGGHVIKCGLSPVLIDLMDRGFVSAVALNGSGSIHDFEVAAAGSTSEDVEKELESGAFGSSGETGQWMNQAMNEGGLQGIGLGEALGAYINRNLDRFPYAGSSLLAAAYGRRIPVTVHVAIGTDTIHNHPEADGGVLGRGSLLDFRLLTSIVRDLHEGGVYLNCGSAVVLPEVFLKTVSIVRNLGYPLESFTTANLDFLQHYRPMQNVVKRPVGKSGQGIALTGHHEIMIPLLAASLIEAESSR